jgi:hypothetical protein
MKVVIKLDEFYRSFRVATQQRNVCSRRGLDCRRRKKDEEPMWIWLVIHRFRQGGSAWRTDRACCFTRLPLKIRSCLNQIKVYCKGWDVNSIHLLFLECKTPQSLHSLKKEMRLMINLEIQPLPYRTS